MSEVFLLTRQQLNRIKPYFPVSHGIPRVDDLRVISGIIYVIRQGLQWKDAPAAYGPHKTLYNRFVRWSRAGIFNVIFRELAKSAEQRPACLKRGGSPVYWPHERRPELETACGLRRKRPSCVPAAVGRADERLHRCQTPAAFSTDRHLSDCRPWLRRRLVPCCVEEKRRHALYPATQKPQEKAPVQQTPLQTAP